MKKNEVVELGTRKTRPESVTEEVRRVLEQSEDRVGRFLRKFEADRRVDRGEDCSRDKARRTGI